MEARIRELILTMIGLRKFCREVVENKFFGLFIFFTIVFSILIIILENIASLTSKEKLILEIVNDFIILIFVVELGIRYLAFPWRFKPFVREHWIDILAILPMLRVFRLGRAFRLVRILRLISLGAIMERNLKVFSFLFNKRIGEYFLTIAFIVFALIFGAIGILSFEKGHMAKITDVSEAFWSSIFSMFAGEYITEFPHTLGGKVVILFVMFSGMGFFAMITGTVSAIMIEKLREGVASKGMKREELENHIIICGWDEGADSIIEEIQRDPQYRKSDIIVISEREESIEFRSRNIDLSRIHFICADFTKVEALEKANIQSAKIAIILSDTSNARSLQDADARTILAALTIEKLNPNIYTCAQINDSTHEAHLRMGGVNDVIVTTEFTGNLLAQAAMNYGTVQVLKDLIDPYKENRLCKFKVPSKYIGVSFTDAFVDIRKKYLSILLAVEKPNMKLFLNPAEYILEEGDSLIAISPRKLSFDICG